MKISYRGAQKKLAICWFIFASIFFLVVVLQTLFGKFGDNVSDVWSWLQSALVPSLSLMITIFVTNINTEDDHQVDVFYFRLTFWISFVYLMILLAHILIEPFSSKTEIQIIKQSKVYIGTIQGIVSASLGLFFVKKEKS